MPEQEVRERRSAALRRGQQRLPCITAVEIEPAARDDAADLVVQDPPQLAAELHRVIAENPREVVDELNRLVVVDERRVALLAKTGKSGDADVRDTPVERIVARNIDAECGDHVLDV